MSFTMMYRADRVPAAVAGRSENDLTIDLEDEGGGWSFRRANRKELLMNQRGLSLIEVLIVVVIISVLAGIVVPAFLDQREKAKLVRCMADLRSIQATVWNWTPDSLILPDAKTFWDEAYGGDRPGPFMYLVDGDPNKGHGNDIDGFDEENPGKSDPDTVDIQFVILCQHDHGDLADYVYVTETGPPKIANADNDPGYERFIKWEFGGPGGGK